MFPTILILLSIDFPYFNRHNKYSKLSDTDYVVCGKGLRDLFLLFEYSDIWIHIQWIYSRTVSVGLKKQGFNDLEIYIALKVKYIHFELIYWLERFD